MFISQLLHHIPNYCIYCIAVTSSRRLALLASPVSPGSGVRCKSRGLVTLLQADVQGGAGRPPDAVRRLAGEPAVAGAAECPPPQLPERQLRDDRDRAAGGGSGAAAGAGLGLTWRRGGLWRRGGACRCRLLTAAAVAASSGRRRRRRHALYTGHRIDWIGTLVSPRRAAPRTAGPPPREDWPAFRGGWRRIPILRPAGRWRAMPPATPSCSWCAQEHVTQLRVWQPESNLAFLLSPLQSSYGHLKHWRHLSRGALGSQAFLRCFFILLSPEVSFSPLAGVQLLRASTSILTPVASRLVSSQVLMSKQCCLSDEPFGK